MRKSTFVAALGTAVTTGGAIAALTVLPLHSVSAQSTGTTGTTDTTVAASTSGSSTTAADPTTTTTPSSSSAAAAPATAGCTSNEDAAHETQESADVEAAENAGQCRGGPHRPGDHHGPGGPGFTPNEDPQHEAQESPDREAQEHSSTTSTTTVAP